MKAFYLIIILAILTMSSYAQEDGMKQKQKPSDHLVVDLFSDVWQGMPDKVNTQTINMGIQFNLMYDRPIKSSKFSVAMGMGVRSHNLHLKATPYLDDTDSRKLSFIPLSDDEMKDLDIKKNKITLTYLNIPLELRWRQQNNKKFKVSVGLKGGYLLGDHYKYKGKDPINMEKSKIKIYDFDVFENVTLNGILRVGYNKFSLYASYPITRYIIENKGEDMRPISFGISIIPY